jgi:hypothetical protein
MNVGMQGGVISMNKVQLAGTGYGITWSGLCKRESERGVASTCRKLGGSWVV